LILFSFGADHMSVSYVLSIKGPELTTEQKFKETLHNYKNGQCSIAELEWLMDYIRSSQSTEMMDDAITDELLEEISNGVTDTPEMRQKLSHLYAGIEKRTKVKVVQWRRWYAAAAILVITLGSVFFMYQKDKTAIENSVSINKIKPGSNRAVLTLANGRSIVLNAAKEMVVIDGDRMQYNDGSEILPKGTKTDFYTISTPKGGQYQVLLADGTKVWLNAASTLKYPSYFNGGKRVVEFEGEGYFEVVSDEQNGKKMPFIVKTPQQEIEVLGTGFNVNNYLDEKVVTTTLLHGRVNVFSKATGKQMSLKPNQQSTISASGTDMEVKDIDAETSVAWKNGYFKFDEADIWVVMRQLSRWYDIDVEVDKSVPALNFSGKIKRSESFKSLLDQLSYFGVRFEVKGRKVFVEKK
jgi:transmembrane sensor